MILKEDSKLLQVRKNKCSGCSTKKDYILLGEVCGTFLVPTQESCGCILSVKQRLSNKHCPQLKW